MFRLLTERQQDQANADMLREERRRDSNRPRAQRGAIGVVETARDIPAGSSIVYDREANALTVIGPDRECIIHAKPFA
jgi:hypothetical protein